MGKTIVITGSNSGIGKAAAIELGTKEHSIIMLCRNEKRGLKAQTEIQEKTKNSNVDLVIADLADFNQILHAADKIYENYEKIDVLINNAGVILTNLEFSKQGVEKTIAVNHLGHFLLTDLLLPKLENATESRIINTSSGAHRSADLNFDDLNYNNSSYSIFGAYGRSKLANILFTHKLDEKLGNKSVFPFSIHPGFVGSNFATNNGTFAKIIMTILRPFAKSPKSGAQPLIYLALTDHIQDDSGKYFVDTKKLPFTSHNIISRPTSQISYDQDLQDLLWQKSKEIILDWNANYEFNI